MKNLLAVFFVLIGYVGFAQKIDSLKVDTIKVVKIEPTLVSKKEYSIKLPIGWKIQDGCTEILCSFLSPADTLGGGYDTYTENINITVEKLSSASYTAEMYTKFSIDYLPKVVKNFKLTEKKKISANTYVINYKGIKSGYEQSWRQFYSVKNAKVYIITFASETKKFAYYEPIVEPYLRSFRLR